MVTASCCQLAFWIKCTCESCTTVEFKVTTKKHSFDLGKMTKKGNGCCVDALNPNYNNFIVEFPKGVNWKVKVKNNLIKTFLVIVHDLCYLH